MSLTHQIYNNLKTQNIFFMNYQIWYLKNNLIRLVFYDTPVEKANCRITVFFLPVVSSSIYNLYG